jgi:hypothetical protein
MFWWSARVLLAHTWKTRVWRHCRTIVGEPLGRYYGGGHFDGRGRSQRGVAEIHFRCRGGPRAAEICFRRVGGGPRGGSVGKTEVATLKCVHTGSGENCMKGLFAPL